MATRSKPPGDGRDAASAKKPKATKPGVSEAKAAAPEKVSAPAPTPAPAASKAPPPSPVRAAPPPATKAPAPSVAPTAAKAPPPSPVRAASPPSAAKPQAPVTTAAAKTKPVKSAAKPASPEKAAPAPAPSRSVPLAAKAGQPLVKEAMETLEGSLKAAGRGTVAVNCKLLDMAQANVNSGLELAKRMAEAKTPLAAWRLQMAYWNERMGAFAAQAQELRALHAELCDTASAPIRAHLKRNGAARPE